MGERDFKEWGGVFKMVGGGESGENSGRGGEFCCKRPGKVFQSGMEPDSDERDYVRPRLGGRTLLAEEQQVQRLRGHG